MAIVPVGPSVIEVSGGVRSGPPKRMKRLTLEPMFQWLARYSPGSGLESK